MSRLLRKSSPVAVAGGAIALLWGGACGGEIETEQIPPGATSSTSTGPGGNTGGNTTVTVDTSSSAGGSGGTTTTNVGGGGGAGGSAGGGGTGPVYTILEDTGGDACDGDAYDLTLSPSTHLKLRGDTATANMLYTGLCAPPETDSGDSPERVYKFTIPAAGTVRMEVRQHNGSTLDPVLYRRKDGMCSDGSIGAALGCFSFFQTHEDFAEHFEATTFYLFIDGHSATAGEYELTVDYTPPECGDGVINPDEDCDDGNTAINDGCDASCKNEDFILFDTCDGEPVVLVDGVTENLTGSTTGFEDHYKATTPNCDKGSTSGVDRVYELNIVGSGVTGTVTAKIGYDVTGTFSLCEELGFGSPFCWNALLWAVGPDACDDGSSITPPGPPHIPFTAPEVACSDGPKSYGPVELSFPVSEGKYYLGVDAPAEGLPGYETYYRGPYNLQVLFEAD